MRKCNVNVQQNASGSQGQNESTEETSTNNGLGVDKTSTNSGLGVDKTYEFTIKEKLFE